MWNVDPTMILSILVSRGAFTHTRLCSSRNSRIAKGISRRRGQIKRCGETEGILYNLTIALEGQGDAIRIGRVFVHWDSYSEPCLDVEVDDVHVLVDFTNLILTHNSWNELRPILMFVSTRR
jgi:hypothetical protein